MSSNLDLVLNKLTRFIKRYYINELIKGLLLFIAIGLLYFIIVLLLENFLWLSTQGRKVLFWTFVGIELLLFFKFIGISLLKLFKIGKQLTPIEASKIIGKHFPNVNDQLVNLLQLNKEPNKSELLQASIEQKSAKLSPVPFASAINFKKSFTYAKYAVIPIIIFVLITLLNGSEWYEKSFTRVVNYNTAYEPPAPFYFKILNENTQVIQQQDFVLNVTTYGSIVPNQVAVTYDNETYFLKKEGHNKFSFVFKNPVSNIDFNLISGDEKSKEYTLFVNEAPSINQFEMVVTSPKHVNQQQKKFTNTGNAIVAEGSRIKWNIKAENASDIKFISEEESKEFSQSNSFYSYGKTVAKSLDYQITTSNKHVNEYEKLAFNIEVIKDKHPSISVQSTSDTTKVNTQLYYRQLSDDYGLRKLDVVYFKQDNPEAVKRAPVKIQRGVFSDFTYQFPNGINLEDATAYSFYFEVFDNDSFRGSKSSKSETFNFRQLSKIESEQSTFKSEQQNLEQFSKSLEDFQKTELDLESFAKLQKQQTSLSFKEKQKLSDVLDKQSEQQKSLKKLSEKLDKTLDKLNEDENSKDIKEQLERSQKELEKNKKLIDEIKKALDKLSPQEIQEKVDELQKENKKVTKNLNQILELTKRYYVIDKHARITQMLELLAEKQFKTADSIPGNTQKEQEQINKEFDIVKEELNDLRKHNERLKKPMKLDDDPAYEDAIKEELEKAKKDLDKDKVEEAKTKQRTSGTMMQNLAKKMSEEAGGGGMGMEQVEEDLEMLRQVLDNLVLFSLNQETNMNSFSGSTNGDPNYSAYIRRQQVLRENFEHIDDSLYAISSRNAKIGTKINDLISEIDYDLSSSLEKLTDDAKDSGVISLQYAVSHSNDLALMLSEFLGQMNAEMKPGKGKGNKKEGFQLPDIIKKQESLNNAMKQMLEGGGEKKKPGQGGKEQEGGEKSPGEKGKQGEQGNKSTQGKQGKEGSKGDTGQSGSNGKQGESGQKGKGQSQPGEGSEGGNSGEGKSGQKGKKGNMPQNGEGDGDGEGENSSEKSGKDGKKGREGKGNKNGKGEGESGEPGEEESDYGELFEIYKKQQELRNQLEDRMQQNGINPQERSILSQMEEVENKLLEQGFTEETMKRMVQLKHQLFKLNKAQFQQGKDNKRKSETNKKDFVNDQTLTPSQIKQYFNSTEILNRQVLPLWPQYKKKVQQYFTNKNSGQ